MNYRYPVKFELDPRYPRKLPDPDSRLFAADIRRYWHIAKWNRPVWVAKPSHEGV